MPYINNDPDDDLDASFVDREFKNKGKPGWFFVCVAREDSAPIGKARHSLYEGPGRLVEESGSLLPAVPNRMFDDRSLPRWESVVVDTVLTEQPLFVTFFEGGKKESYFAGDFVRNVPPGKSTIRLAAIDFQSDFEATDGSWRAAYAKRRVLLSTVPFSVAGKCVGAQGLRFPRRCLRKRRFERRWCPCRRQPRGQRRGGPAILRGPYSRVLPSSLLHHARECGDCRGRDLERGRRSLGDDQRSYSLLQSHGA